MLQCVVRSADGLTWEGVLLILSFFIGGIMHVGVRIFGGRYYRKAGEAKEKKDGA